MILHGVYTATVVRQAVGGTAILHCHCNCTLKGERWRKDGDILSSGLTVVNHTNWTNRLSLPIVHRPRSGEYDLRIDAVRLEDAGDYLCEIHDGPKVSEEKITLIIYGMRNSISNFGETIKDRS